MADMLQFKITPLGAVSASIPRAQIEALVVDSANQSSVIADFTGVNALIFPGVITTLSAADRLELAQMIAGWLVNKKAGV